MQSNKFRDIHDYLGLFFRWSLNCISSLYLSQGVLFSLFVLTTKQVHHNIFSPYNKYVTKWISCKWKNKNKITPLSFVRILLPLFLLFELLPLASKKRLFILCYANWLCLLAYTLTWNAIRNCGPRANAYVCLDRVM